MKIKRCDLCTFCKNAEENIRHLFWDCPTVRHFLNSIKDELERCWPYYDLGFTPNNVYGRELFILGDNRPNSGLAPNYMYNVVKKFIWNTRCLVPEHPPPPPPHAPQAPPPMPPPLDFISTTLLQRKFVYSTTKNISRILTKNFRL